jgi:ferredoxin
MRIVIDSDRCQANARCVAAAPEVFDVDDDGYVVVLQPHPLASLAKSVEAAVRSCPTGAITVQLTEE